MKKFFLITLLVNISCIIAASNLETRIIDYMTEHLPSQLFRVIDNAHQQLEFRIEVHRHQNETFLIPVYSDGKAIEQKETLNFVEQVLTNYQERISQKIAREE